MMVRSYWKWTSAVLLTSLFLSACSSKDKDAAAKKNAPRPPSRVEGYVVTPQALSQDIEMPGSLTPFEETEIHPEVAGRVTGIYFKEGANVSQGSVLVKLYDGDLQAQLKKLEVQLKVAQQTLSRYEELAKIQGVSQQEVDLNRLSMNNIIADISIIKTSISKTSLRAPFSGKLGLRNISMGAYVSPATLITTLRKVSQLKMEFTVPEKYGTQMQPGHMVSFSSEGSTKNYAARVIATENDIAEESRSLKVRAVVDKPDAQLIPGSFVKVQIPLGKNDAALMIPSQAVIPKARTKEVIVYRGGIASMETVTTGIRDSSNVEITSGLKAGDTIILTGLLTIKPKAKIVLGKVTKP
jgi:membrane fusion protein (multidrug efflux system)